MSLFKRKKPPAPSPAPAAPPPVVWHPVLRADMGTRSFSYDGSKASIGKVHVYDHKGYFSASMWFSDAHDLRAFGEDCIAFANRCDGLRSLTESEVKP